MYSFTQIFRSYPQATEDLPEADSKVAALNSKAANLCAKLDESRKESIQQMLQDVQDNLRMLTEIAKEHKSQLELQDSLSEELQSFRSAEKKTQSWVEELKKDLVSLGKSTHGTQEQIEERLNKAQVSDKDTGCVLFRFISCVSE